MTGYGTHCQPAGTWSDDTSMTLAACDSIREKGAADIDDIREKFCRWAFKAEYTVDNEVFDIGGTTITSLETGKGQEDFYSNGNGSLMRILPLAFIDADEQTAADVSAITHAHSISKNACCEYVYIARQLISGRNLMEILSECSERLPLIHTLDADEIKSTGYVTDTLEAALWTLATSESYRDAVLKAVNLGDDTDTAGAVTGGLAGIIYGMEGIPKEWLETLRGKEIIDRCLF